MNKKINIFLDFDDTITLSAKQFVHIANKMFKVSYNWRNVKKWDFSDLYPNINGYDVEDIFRSKDFFDNLELQKDCEKYIKMLNEISNIYIITKGSPDNLEMKKAYINRKLPLNEKLFKDNFIGIPIDSDKSLIDMSGSIFIDDRMDNLAKSNASIKILYKNNNNFEWQKNDTNQENLYVVNTWEEIYSILNFFINNPEFIGRNVLLDEM